MCHSLAKGNITNVISADDWINNLTNIYVFKYTFLIQFWQNVSLTWKTIFKKLCFKNRYDKATEREGRPIPAVPPPWKVPSCRWSRTRQQSPRCARSRSCELSPYTNICPACLFTAQGKCPFRIRVKERRLHGLLTTPPPGPNKKAHKKGAPAWRSRKLRPAANLPGH